MATSPTRRTLQWLRDDGWIPAVVERWCSFSRRRIDLFGFIDIVAIKPGTDGVLGIQATSGPNMSSRVRKIRRSGIADLWMECDNGLWVVGWRKVAWVTKSGEKAKRPKWEPRVVDIREKQRGSIEHKTEQ